MENNEIALQEARENLRDINNGVENSKKRSWQLLAIIIAIDVFLIKGILDNESSDAIRVIGLIAIPFTIYIFKNLSSGINPSGLRDMGIQPDLIKPIMDKDKSKFMADLLYSYQTSINKNTEVLELIINDYKKSLTGIIIFIIASGVSALLIPIFQYHPLW